MKFECRFLKRMVWCISFDIWLCLNVVHSYNQKKIMKAKFIKSSTRIFFHAEYNAAIIFCHSDYRKHSTKLAFFLIKTDSYIKIITRDIVFFVNEIIFSVFKAFNKYAYNSLITPL